MEASRLDPAEAPDTTRDEVGRALVIGIVSRDRVRVRTASGHVRVATLAAAGYADPREGDGVVVIAGASETFVVGVLGLARLRSPLPLEGSVEPGGERDAPGPRASTEPLPGLARESTDGVASVRFADGDLRLEVTQGALEIVARDGVRLSTDARLSIAAADIDARATTADVTVDETKLVGRTITTAVETVVVVADRVETEANRIVERAKAAYREIEDVAQTRAGRIRAIARGTLALFGKNASLVAEEDAKVDGNKVMLG
ncbi:MAG: DUF3540 domain-containing protein [Deltaproteobacteria bacterium]|nr:DUF3540 domain-containing protein [Deltaproteobacteria bacterium]